MSNDNDFVDEENDESTNPCGLDTCVNSDTPCEQCRFGFFGAGDDE